MIRINTQAFCSGMNYIDFANVNLVGRILRIEGARTGLDTVCPWREIPGLPILNIPHFNITSQTFVSSGNYVELGVSIDPFLPSQVIVAGRFAAITIV